MSTRNKSITSATLSPARRRLLELFRAVDYGRVERLHVREGEPLFDPPPRVVRRWRFTTPKARRPATLGATELKDQMLTFLAVLDQVGTGTIDSIEVAAGLPLLAEAEDAGTLA